MGGRSGSCLDERIRILNAEDDGPVDRNYRESLDDHLMDPLVSIHFTPEDTYQIFWVNVNAFLFSLGGLFQRIQDRCEEDIGSVEWVVKDDAAGSLF